MNLSPVTREVLVQAADRHGYASLPGAAQVASGSTEPQTAAAVAQALLEDLADAEVLRCEYGHERGIRAVRRELDALVAEAGRVACECGEVTGERCAASCLRGDAVTVETMPEHLRESHIAAGNSGRYPHNGAVRALVTPQCAQQLVSDDEWTRIVG